MTISKTVSTRMVLLVIAIGMTALVTPAVNGDSKQHWKKLQLGPQGLSVSMPGAATPKDIHTKSFIGDITTHEYYVDDGRDSYSVEFSDLPGFAVTFSGSDVIYEHAKGALLKKTLRPILKDLLAMSPDELTAQRQEKFRKIGEFSDNSN